MTEEHWERVRRLFGEAAELPEIERARFLKVEAGDDAKLLRDIEALLDADDDASRFLEDGPLNTAWLSDPPADHWVGRRFGPYEAVREIGRGGMGIVLLGERADGRYQGQVAIKIVHTTLMRGDLVERFRAEGQILANLDHPNIARLLDAGDTDDGLSYLIMEYVDGPRIDEYADQQLLDVPGRLALFRSVLDGVDYAHARGVIHRDLKPSNILVNSDGRPKLVDFGIAKLFAPTPADDSTVARTLTSSRMMTPEYASPEQVRGLPVSTSSDVYSLGVVLYRLLTGRAPYDLPSTQPRKAEQIICEESPKRPSTAITLPTTQVEVDAPSTSTDPAILARNRSSTLDRLQRTLRGDLDTIVLKALSKETGRRYTTAGAFGDDIDRYLDGRPIVGHAPGTLYRAGRFVRRRRVPLAIAGVVIAGLGATAWQATVAAGQRGRAESSSAELTQLVASIVARLDRVEYDGRGPTPAREDVATSALEALNELVLRTEGNAEPDLLLALSRAYKAVGDVQGNPFEPNLGKHDEARQSYEKSIELIEAVMANQPRSALEGELAEYRVMLADVYNYLGRPSEADRLLAVAQPVMDSIFAANPEDTHRANVSALVWERVGMSRETRGDRTGALEALEKAISIRLQSGPVDDPELAAAYRQSWANVQMNLANILGRLGRYEESVASAREVARVFDSVAALPGAAQADVRAAALGRNQLGWRLLEANLFEEADQHLTASLDLLEPLLRSDPQNMRYIADVASGFEGRGQLRIKSENWTGALEDHRQAIALLEDRLEEFPFGAYVVGQAYRQAGEALTALDRFREAEGDLNRSVEILNALWVRDTTFAEGRKILALSFNSLETLRLAQAASGASATACPQAKIAGDAATSLWNLSEVSEGESRIWQDFEARKPVGTCGRSDRSTGETDARRLL